MTVYVDSEFITFRNMKMCHMIADTEQELEEIAKKLKLNLNWWQHKGTYKSHFDVAKSVREKAIKLGAIIVEREEFVSILKRKKGEL